VGTHWLDWEVVEIEASKALPAERSSRGLTAPTRGDILTGLGVALVLIPQALANAEIAGLPPVAGLYAAALPPVAAALFASSRYLQTGPVAMTALLTFGALSVLSEPGTLEYVQLAILLALVVGVTRIAFGLIGAGLVAYLMSQPVLLGFTSAAAILIIASQIPTALGVEPTSAGLLSGAFDAIVSLDEWQAVHITIAVVTGLIIFYGRRIHPLFPGVLVAVALALAASVFFGFTGETVGAIPRGLPRPTLDLPWSSLPYLLLPGAVIALVGFAEAVAISRTYAAQDREPWDPNREFISQGVANVVSAASGGFPVGGSFSRTSLAKLSGARTRWAGAIAGLLVLAFLPVADVLAALPRATLAGIVIVAIAPLVRMPTLVRLIRVTWGQSVVAWGTFVATLALSPRIDIAVTIGIALATLVHLRRESLIEIETERWNEALILRPSGVLYFGSAPRLSEALLDQLADHGEAVERVIVDLSRLGRVDYTGAVALKSFSEDCTRAGLDFELRAVPKHAEGTLERYWGTELAQIWKSE